MKYVLLFLILIFLVFVIYPVLVLSDLIWSFKLNFKQHPFIPYERCGRYYTYEKCKSYIHTTFEEFDIKLPD